MLRNLLDAATVPLLTMGMLRYEGPTPKMARQARLSAWVMVLLFGGLTVGLAIAEHRWSYLAAIPFVMFPAWVCVAQATQVTRMVGRGAFVTEETVGALADGEIAWSLPWTDYGGFAPIPQAFAERMLHPELGGVEVLNRRGIAVGTLPVGHYRIDYANTAATANANLTGRLITRALIEKIPKGSPYASRAIPPRKLMPKWAATVMLCGAPVSLIAVLAMVSIMFRHAGDAVPHWSAFMVTPWGALGTLAGATLLIVLMAWSGGDLYAHIHPNRQSLPEIPDPQEGPTELEFIIARSGATEPVELEDGVRYRYVHPEMRERAIAAGVRDAASLKWLAIALLVMFGFAFSLNPSGKPMDFLFVAMALIMISPLFAASHFSGKAIRASRERLHDTIIKHDGQITIVHEDGSHQTFSPRAKLKKSPTGVGEILVEGKQRYAIDRRRLYASETPLDQEELHA